MLRMFKGQSAARAVEAPAQPIEFPSQCLGEFLGRLRRVDPHPAVLDLGVLCGDNIAFMGERGCRVSVESLPMSPQEDDEDGAGPDLEAGDNGFDALDPGEDGPRETSFVPSDVPTAPLNYPHESFSGVLAWDAISQMPFQEGVAFVETLRQLLLEGGVILAYFPGPPGNPQGSSGRYRILDEDRLIVEPAEVTGRSRVYENREIYALFSRCDVVRLSHLKSGTREVLAVKTAPQRQRRVGRIYRSG